MLTCAYFFFLQNIENKIPKIKSLFIKYGVKRAFLFGSIAKGINTNKSDVDFLYSFPDDLDFETYSSNYFKLIEELEKLLNKRVDLVAEKTLKNPYLIESIEESKIQLL
jgi:predicted nucleotidyltransferase